MLELLNNYYFTNRLIVNKTSDMQPSAMCPVFSFLAFWPPKSISVPVQATSAKAILNNKANVIFYSSKTQ
jgi:hypothetical protein